MIDRIVSLTNDELVALLNYLYERIPSNEKSSKYYKHIDIAKFIFNSYEPSLGQTISRLFTKNGTLRSSTVKKINLKKLKDFLLNNTNLNNDFSLNNSLEVVEVPVNDIVVLIDEKTISCVNLLGNILHISEGVELNLENEETFKSDLLKLSGESVQLLFGYLENKLKSKYNNGHSVTKELISIIILDSNSQKNKNNIHNKIIKLRTKSEKLTPKFLKNNINITSLKKFILSDDLAFDEIANLLNSEETLKNPNFLDINNTEIDINEQSFDFYIEDKDEDNENLQKCIKVKLNGKKDLGGFIYSLNSLVSEQINNLDLEGYFSELIEEDFQGIELDSEFFNNVRRLKNSDNISDMFDVLGKDVLGKFIILWHKEVDAKLKKSKKVHIESGSEEEMFDFVFNVWQSELNKIAIKENRRSGRTRNNLGDRLNKYKLTKEMFIGHNKLTLDLPYKVDSKLFNIVLSKIPKHELQYMIKEYLEEKSK